jgi:hypothetical protein
MTRTEGVATAPCLDGITTTSLPGAGKVSLEPASAYEAVTRQMVLDMGEDLREIKSRLNGLLFMVAGAVVLEVVTRVMG